MLEQHGCPYPCVSHICPTVPLGGGGPPYGYYLHTLQHAFGPTPKNRVLFVFASLVNGTFSLSRTLGKLDFLKSQTFSRTRSFAKVRGRALYIEKQNMTDDE
jgi:hypothetical protein